MIRSRLKLIWRSRLIRSPMLSLKMCRKSGLIQFLDMYCDVKFFWVSNSRELWGIQIRSQAVMFYNVKIEQKSLNIRRYLNYFAWFSSFCCHAIFQKLIIFFWTSDVIWVFRNWKSELIWISGALFTKQLKQILRFLRNLKC